jgi:hypothetical protein
VYQASLIPNKGNFSTVISNGLIGGEYNITSFVSDHSAKAFNFISGTSASTDIKVENFFQTRIVLVIIIGLTFGLAGVIAIIVRVQKKRELSTFDEIIQFIFMSILAFTPILAFAFTDVAIFPNSPIGIVIKPSVVASSQNSTEVRSEWMINIGGISADKYKSGIQVPLTILIFGIAGGYLRYLCSEAEPVWNRLKKSSKDKKSKTDQLDGNDKQLDKIYEILYNVIILFLSPLLAIAVWLVLWQGGTTSPFTLAAMSFVTGLVTKEAVRALIEFASRIFQSNEKDKDEDSSNVREPQKADTPSESKPVAKVQKLKSGHAPNTSLSTSSKNPGALKF